MTDENVVHAKWDSAQGEKDYVVNWKANSVLLVSCSMPAVHTAQDLLGTRSAEERRWAYESAVHPCGDEG